MPDDVKRPMHCYHFGIGSGWQIPTQHDEHANLYLSFVTSPFYYLFRYMLLVPLWYIKIIDT